MLEEHFPFSACRNELLVVNPSPGSAASPILTQPQNKCCLMILPRAPPLVMPWGLSWNNVHLLLYESGFFQEAWPHFNVNLSRVTFSQQGKDIPESGKADLRMCLNLSSGPFVWPTPLSPSLPRYSVKAPSTPSITRSMLESQSIWGIIVLLKVFSPTIKEDAGRERCFTRSKL